MLKYLQKSSIQYQFAIEKKLFVYQHEDNKQSSGIRATIFGASGILGLPLCSLLGQIGSSMIIPLSLQHHFRHSQHLKDLKTTGSTNKTWLQWDMNFKNQKMIEDMVKNSNVVINLLGPRKKVKKLEDFQFINIQVAQKIAKACKKHGVHRLIHFSAAGADPNSPSLDFQTKHHAQQLVKKAFPNVTIFRPCTIFGLNDHFASNILRQHVFFMQRFVPVFDDCTTLKQPIKQTDLAVCILNALKLQQSKGKTYQLGGPHKLTYLQIHQIMFNLLKHRTKLAYVNKDFAMFIAKYIYNWQLFGQQVIRKKTIQQIVKNDKYLTIEDLKVQPVSFKNGIFEVVKQYIATFYQKNQDYQN